MTRYTPAMVLAMGIWLGLAALPLLGMPMAAEADELIQGEASQVVSGTLTHVDLVGMKGALSTDLGQSIFFDITKPQLFEHLSLGSRVTIELNSEGEADRVVGASMADLLEPDQSRP